MPLTESGVVRRAGGGDGGVPVSVGRCAGALALLAAVAVGCADGREPPTGSVRAAITEGAPTDGDPAVAALRARRALCPEGHDVDTFCSAVLVAPRVLLTAAHCLSARRVEEMEAYFGSHVAVLGYHARIVEAHLHPAYDPDTRQNDLALLLLAEPAPVRPAQLREAALEAGAVGQTIRIVGFGASFANGDAGAKQTGNTLITSVDATTFRTAPGPSLICGADSGSAALLVEDGVERVFGIARSGDAACDEFGVHTRVDAYLADFVAPYLEAVEATMPGGAEGLDPGEDFCARACAEDADCPTGMLCLPEAFGKRCGYRELRSGLFGEACSVSDDCDGPCVAFGAGSEQTCHCFTSCRELLMASPGPEPSSSRGCAFAGEARMTLPASRSAPALVLLALACARLRRPATRSRADRG
ncbi:trypsin-like serine protease [Sorangium sp. So ce176]|uniref:trypsin-like serine protease n=1 Tax=Sorangium sp. So ce176 TaxID=3133286 RepID=UPI003F5E2B40